MSPDAGRHPDAEASAAPDEAAVVRFLERRPSFLREHPSLYLTLAPPARVHGEAVADHMAAMIGAARRQNAELRDQLCRDLRDRRAGRGFAQRVGEALVWLAGLDDPLPAIAAELALALDTDTAILCLEADAEPPPPGMRALPAGRARRLLGGRDVAIRDDPDEPEALHGGGARLVASEALVRVPLDRDGAPRCLLALGSRDRGAFPPAVEAPLALLGRGVAAALGRGGDRTARR